MGKFHPGQKVILQDHAGAVEATVERVGRKWVYIKRYAREVAFDAQTGCENTQFGTPVRIYTFDDWADVSRRSDLLCELRDYGIEWRLGGYERHYTTDTLEQLAKLLASAEMA